MLPGLAAAIAGAGSAATAPYSETSFLGNYTDNRTYNSGGGADFKNALQITVPGGGVWAKRITMLVHTCAASGLAKAIVFSGTTTSSSLVVGGIEVAPGVISSPTDVDLWFNAGHTAVFFAAGTYFIGQHSNGNTTNIVNGAQNLPINGTYFVTDTYADGIATPWTSMTGSPSALACYKMPYSVTGP